LDRHSIVPFHPSCNCKFTCVLEQKQHRSRGNEWFQLREFLELFVYELCESNGDDYFQNIAILRSSEAYGMQHATT
jgi:hypothetical protein